jgi:hypothetical protein
MSENHRAASAAAKIGASLGRLMKRHRIDTLDLH